jgi:predicted nucleic acid-binding protein
MAWRQDERVQLVGEPSGLAELWPRLALRNDRSPKLWTDAYLASLAIAGDHCLVTFDRAYRQFEPQGLTFKLLETNQALTVEEMS